MVVSYRSRYAMKRSICVVITARATYSRFKTALFAIHHHPALELKLIVAASALTEKYGAVIHEIEADGLPVTARIENLVESESASASSETAALGMLELAPVFQSIKPDAVVTIADRFETMATALCASLMNIPLVHVQGGEITGNIDEKIRHAITKLSDLHLVSNTFAARRIVRMGERIDAVHITGCPSIDLAISVNDGHTETQIAGESNLSRDSTPPYLVVMQHPVTTEFQMAKRQVEITLEVIRQLGLRAYWFWPNPDAGTAGTAEALDRFRERTNDLQIHFFRNMPSTDFLKLLKGAACLVGNSSVGIRECAFLGVPVVNIGSRQCGRQRGPNVLDAGYSAESIRSAILYQLKHGPYPSQNIYGDGKAGQRIADILATAELHITKKMTY